MSIESRVEEVADSFVAQAQAASRRLKIDLIEAERSVATIEAELRIATIEAELDAVRQVSKRRANFQATRNRIPQCPCCWMQRGVQANMPSRPETDQYDLYKCHACGLEITDPF